MANFQPPRLINGRYALQGDAIAGGTADVYRAIDVNGGDKVAVKIFRTGALDDDMIREVYSREVAALQELRHEAIVELRDHGIDNVSGKSFIVLEWMESDLSQFLRQHRPAGWDSFYESIGRPLLKALEFAHKRLIIHRDVKPKNILMDAADRIRLADFGISKLKRIIDPSITLNEFVSRPFSPPEQDNGEYTYSRDVFAFAVVGLYCLTEDALSTYEDVRRALSECDLPDDILPVLTKALSEEPEQRQQNAGVLLAELESVAEIREIGYIKKEDVFLQLHPAGLRKAKALFQTIDTDQMEALIREDLESVCAIVRQEENAEQQVAGPRFRLIGASCVYIAALDSVSEASLLIIDAWRGQPSVLERMRDDAYFPKFYSFLFGRPSRPSSAKETILKLRLELDQHASELAVKQLERAEDELFRTWANTLKAKADLEMLREEPIRYSDISEDAGNRIVFELVAPPTNDVIGQARQIRQHGITYVTGDVETLEGQQLTLDVEKRFTAIDYHPAGSW